MTPNEMMNMTPIQKADTVLNDLVTGGGYLSEVEMDRFLKQSIKEAELTKECRRVLMRARQEEIPRLRFADGADNFILYPLTENAAHPVAERSAPAFGALNLTAVGFGGQVSIPDQVFLYNVEKDQLAATVRELVYAKMGADIEKIAIRGDLTSAVPSLAALDGWIVQAVTNPVAAAGARLTDTLLGQARRALPEEYDKGEVKFMTSKKAREDWWNSIETRGTPLGDIAVTSGVAKYRDDVVQKYSLWPSAMGGTSDRTVCLYGEPKNFVLGVVGGNGPDGVRLETGRSIETRQVVIVFDVYMAVGYEVEPGVVNIGNVLNS